jgi:hypothetical protein
VHSSSAFNLLLTAAEPVLCLSTLAVIIYRKQFRQFRLLTSLLSVRLTTLLVLLPLLFMTGKQLRPVTAYHIYFPVYWSGYAIEAMLGLCVIYEVYRLAMAPLRGLQALGMLMFRWAAGIAIAVALGMAFGPHMTSQSFVIGTIRQLQQTQSILTLCLLLFVCFAIRPMGLSHRSRIFGVSLGLGILATSQLIGSAWIAHSPRIVSTFNTLNSVVYCLVLLTWLAYFALPEPKRRMIVLPTTSPFLRWNQISLALGDEPGFVAVGGVHPEIFAPAEVEIMRRASLKMNTVTTYS